MIQGYAGATTTAGVRSSSSTTSDSSPPVGCFTDDNVFAIVQSLRGLHTAFVAASLRSENAGSRFTCRDSGLDERNLWLQIDSGLGVHSEILDRCFLHVVAARLANFGSDYQSACCVMWYEGVFSHAHKVLVLAASMLLEFQVAHMFAQVQALRPCLSDPSLCISTVNKRLNRTGPS